MQLSNRHAFKEWASVCHAVAAGRQTIVLRKGGIHERLGRFAAEHGEFWLFATRFHQAETELSATGRPFLAGAGAAEPESGLVHLPVYAVVTDVMVLTREECLPALRPYHIYADHVLAERFAYKRPGLTLLVIRAFTSPSALLLPDSPHFAGCRSWVDLPSDLPTADLKPVLDDAGFERLRGEILSTAQRTATA